MRPGISFRSTLEVPILIDLDGVKPIWIHFRRIEHDVVSSAIPSKMVRLELSHWESWLLPVCNLPVMHKFNALCGECQEDT